MRLEACRCECIAICNRLETRDNIDCTMEVHIRQNYEILINFREIRKRTVVVYYYYYYYIYGQNPYTELILYRLVFECV